MNDVASRYWLSLEHPDGVSEIIVGPGVIDDGDAPLSE